MPLLEPEVPLDLAALDIALFCGPPSLLGQPWRGSYARYDARSFPDVIARHDIELTSDEDEIQNVRLAAEAVDGLILAPYETFSFNEVVGRRSEEKGYRPGLMFAQGQVVTGIGGGVCIVSTALYNAALRAGLKILERSPHSGWVRYAEPGFDAAVAAGSLDLKFKNDSDSPILIQAILDGKTLKVKFYGKRRPGCKIELVQEGYREIPYKVFEKPDESVPDGQIKVKVEARPGYEVTTVRLFKQDGKLIRREVVARSIVPPRHKVVLVPKQAASKPRPESRGNPAAGQQVEMPTSLVKPPVDAFPPSTGAPSATDSGADDAAPAPP